MLRGGDAVQVDHAEGVARHEGGGVLQGELDEAEPLGEVHLDRGRYGEIWGDRA